VLSAHAVPAVARAPHLERHRGALAVPHRGGELRAELADAARRAFVTGMDAALLVGAVVVAASAVLVLVGTAGPRRPQGRLRAIRTVPFVGRSAWMSSGTQRLATSWRSGRRQRCGCAPGERTRRNAVKVRDALLRPQ